MENFIVREYRFQGHVAQEVGVNGAIMLTHIKGWVLYNKDHNTNLRDGEYWTYSSKKGLTNTFPFWSERQIRTILDKLIEGGYIKTGNYNKAGYDRTLWYTLTLKGWALFSTTYMPEWTVNIGQKSPMEKTEKSNGLDENGQPIPIINTNINNNINTTKKKETKKKYGQYKNVRLTDKELDSLIADYGKEIIDEYITKLDEGIELKGYKYKNFNLAMRNWLRNAKITPLEAKDPRKDPEQAVADEEYFTKLLEEQMKGNKLG